MTIFVAGLDVGIFFCFFLNISITFHFSALNSILFYMTLVAICATNLSSPIQKLQKLLRRYFGIIKRHLLPFIIEPPTSGCW